MHATKEENAPKTVYWHRELPPLEVRPVHDRETRLGFIQVAGSSFHLPNHVARLIYDSERYWHGDMTGWVGYVRGKAVATAVTCVDSGAVGLYSVATLREFRRRGYGEAVTRHALDAARSVSGIERSILQSTPAGFSMYSRMGYRPMGQFAVYVSER